MAVRIDAEGYFLDPNGQRSTTIDQSDHDKWKKRIDDAWAAGHPGQSAPPGTQTIMVVQQGDCQWTIALQAGASPTQAAYKGSDGVWLNGQYMSNPDLIHPGDIEFLPKSTTYAVTPASDPTPANGGVPAIPGAPAHDNTDLFVGQVTTAAGNDSLKSSDKSNPVVQSVDSYVGSFPNDPSLGLQALSNMLKVDWGTNDSGRQVALDDYFKGLTEKGTKKEDLMREGDQLKVDMGLGVWMTPGSDGKPTYSDRANLTQAQQHLVSQINEAAGIT
jgi:hypothetical protein